MMMMMIDEDDLMTFVFLLFISSATIMILCSRTDYQGLLSEGR